MNAISPQSPILTWPAEYAEVWGNQPLRFKHRLNENYLFSDEALARYIESCPPEYYTLVHMNKQGDAKKFWQYGRIGEASGETVLRAIAEQRLWINLLHVNKIDARYKRLLDAAFVQLEGSFPGFRTFNRINGILISNPAAQVHYHFDPAGQSLWQVRGSKRLHLYPNVAPFLTHQALEHVAMYADETKIRYEPWFDAFSTPYDLHPGDMLHWPLNCPHRVENLDGLSVSMTTEYYTETITRSNQVNLANGILRKCGLSPERQLTGPAFHAKKVLQAVVRRSGVLNGERKARLAPTFKLSASGEIVPLS